MFFKQIFVKKKHAITDGPESSMYQNGEYKFGLIRNAEIVSDISDSDLCPKYPNLNEFIENFYALSNKCNCSKHD